MSGIAGYINLKGGRNSLRKNLISLMLGLLNPAGAGKAVILRESESVGLGLVVSSVGEANYSVDDNIAVVFHGYLTNESEFAGLSQLSQHARPESELISHLYGTGGQAVPEILKGKYCYAIWDETKATLTLATDRFGYGYLYYYQDNALFVFATEISAVIPAMRRSPDPNLDGICDILNYHNVYNNETAFSGIHLLPYGSIFEVSKNGLVTKRYWDYVRCPKFVDRDEDELFQSCTDAMISSVGNAIKGYDEVGIMVTTGLDSRWIAGAVKEFFPAKKTYLFHVDNGRECLAGVQEMARCLQLPLVVRKEGKDEYVNQLLNKWIFHTYGHVAPYVFLSQAQLLAREHPGSVLLTGYLFDELFNLWIGPYLPEGSQEPTDSSSVPYLEWSVLPDYLIDMVFLPEFGHRLKQRKREVINEANADFASAHPVEKAFRFYCTNRGRRQVYDWMNQLNAFIKIAMPGIDYDLHDFVMTVPYSYRKNTDFYRKFICKTFPALGDIVWTKTGKPLHLGQAQKPFLERHSKLLKYVLQRLSRGRVDLLNPVTSFDRLFRQHTQFRNQICTLLLDTKATGRGFFRREGLERLVNLQLSGRDHGYTFESLLSVECLFRRFFD